VREKVRVFSEHATLHLPVTHLGRAGRKIRNGGSKSSRTKQQERVQGKGKRWDLRVRPRGVLCELKRFGAKV